MTRTSKLGNAFGSMVVGMVGVGSMNMMCGSVAASAVLVCVSHVQAQNVQNVAPYYAVVTGEQGTLRCGPTSNSYSVSTLAAGSIVIVEGEASGWSRVLYPAGLHAFVPAVAATVSDKTVTLARADDLFAASALRGWSGSWKSLMDAPLQAGATLTLVDTVKEGDVPVAYKVEAPSGSRGFVAGSAIRRATDSEVEAFRAKGNVVAALPAAAADAVNAVVNGAGLAAPTAVDVVVESGAVSGDGQRPVTIKREMPGEAGAQPSISDPLVIQGGQNQQAHAGGHDVAQSLEGTFQKLWREPVLSAEVDELIGEYERAIGSESQERRRTAMNQRLEALKLRRDFRDNLRRMESERAAINARQTEVNRQLEEWASNRVYTIVGVLQPSTVYDGSRLPHMYRVVSVGGTSPKTMGYIRKTKDVDLDKYLGMIVGVVGENTLDVAMQLNVISAVRVDPLRSPTGLEISLPVQGATPAPTAPTAVPADAFTSEGGS
jgi:hypothetical protein